MTNLVNSQLRTSIAMATTHPRGLQVRCGGDATEDTASVNVRTALKTPIPDGICDDEDDCVGELDKFNAATGQNSTSAVVPSLKATATATATSWHHTGVCGQTALKTPDADGICDDVNDSSATNFCTRVASATDQEKSTSAAGAHP